MKFRYQFIVFGYGTFVFWLLTKPRVFEGVPPLPYVDSVGHAVLFAGMSWIIYCGIVRSEPLTRMGVMCTAAFLGSALYGAFLELVQLTVPLRSFEWGDIAANCFGSLVATGFAARRFQRPHEAQ